MLIWINGPFGVGKTSAARAILALRPEARLIDPEQIGFMLRRLWPEPVTGDFQDLPAWRILTLRTLAEAARATPRLLVVPMTVADPARFRAIVGGLRAERVPLAHFTLMAPAATIRRRLRWRIDRPASRRWAAARLDSCLDALAADLFAVHIDTDGRSPASLAAELLARAAEQAPSPP